MADGFAATPRQAQQAASMSSPQFKIDHVDDSQEIREESRLPLETSSSEPRAMPRYSSPLRQHKRTPSAHREIKETLDARVEFTSDESDGRTYHRINQYVIVDEIGRGSYGAVHLATDQFGNEYAVKEFSKTRLRKRAQSHILRRGPQGSRHPRFPRRDGTMGPLSPQMTGLRADEQNDALFLIREEIAIMKKLNHPNLVQLIEVLDDPEEDSFYMVMEMCKNGVIMSVGLDSHADPYNDESCRYWFRDLLLGIEYLHYQGIIHRDIKPDNLLLSEDQVLKIVDFGVSEMFDKPDNMKISKSAGSPAFMPPELCGKHREVSGTAADIWSMGVTLYCLKYGKIPFNRPGVLEIYDAIKTDEPVLPEDEDSVFVDLMAKILEKDPEKRITMPQLRDNCEHMLEPPNELELSRAFTRKMNHLLCVMKAIHKFRMLLANVRAKSGTNARGASTSLQRVLSDDASFDADKEKARAEEIETLLARRRHLLQLQDGDADTGHAHSIDDQEPLFLGIGTGSRDAFATEESSPDVVSNSPTAVDFNVYDRAYEEAIKRRMDARPSKRPTMYLTKLVKETDYFKKMEDLVEGSLPSPPALKAEFKEVAHTLTENVPCSPGTIMAQLVDKVSAISPHATRHASKPDVQ